VFAALPARIQQRAARSLDLIVLHPRMYPVRRRGIMRGYRYFLANGYLFYYSVSSTEVRISAIIPAVMRRA
jgi:plasmid stabilization system protein ParE